MRTLNLSIPDSVNLEERETTMLIATGLCEKGKLSGTLQARRSVQAHIRRNVCHIFRNMRPILMRLPPLLLFTLLPPILACAQTFYVVAPINFPVGNEAFQLSTSECGSLPMFVCQPTNNIGQYPENQFTDIAIDNGDYLYYTSGHGSLYRRSLADTTSCEFLGSFLVSTNALVVAQDNGVYAAANVDGLCTLYRFDIADNAFETIGVLPAGLYSAGDLFFYEGNLFLTGTSSDLSSSFLVLVDIEEPAASCVYMGLENLQPFSAFCVNNDTHSEAYILSKVDNQSSALIRLDLDNRSFGEPICIYPFLPNGAASSYSNSGEGLATCDVSPVDVNSIPWSTFTVQNPISENTLVFTGIDWSLVENILLYDMFGRQLKEFRFQGGTLDLDVKDVSPGLYLLHVTSRHGQSSFTRIVKSF